LDSRSVLTVSEDGQVARWAGSNFQQSEPLMQIGPDFLADRRFLLFSPNARFLAVGSTNGILRVWDISGQTGVFECTNTTSVVAPMEFRPDANELVTYSENDNSVYRWDLPARRQKSSVVLPPWPRAGALSPNGRLAVVADKAGNVWRLDPYDDSESKLDPPLLEASDVAFSRDGRLVAISSIPAVVRVWDTFTWRCQATNLYGLFSVAFSPDGKRLATGSGGSNAVKLWDTRSWQNVLTLKGEGWDFEEIRFSQDGSLIGSLNRVGTLHLWRAPSREEIATEEKARGETAHLR